MRGENKKRRIRRIKRMALCRHRFMFISEGAVTAFGGEGGGLGDWGARSPKRLSTRILISALARQPLRGFVCFFIISFICLICEQKPKKHSFDHSLAEAGFRSTIKDNGRQFIAMRGVGRDWSKKTQNVPKNY